MQAQTLDLREIIVFLFAAGIIAPLVRRLKISPVFGFLAVGMAIGPFGLARFSDAVPWLDHILITDPKGVRVLAEMGVVFLLFMIGLELSLDRLWAMRRRVFGMGTAQIVVSGAVIAAIAWSFGNSIAISVVLGASFALSSTAIVMQLLTENRRLGTATGQGSFAILLCQDLAVLPILFLIAVLGQHGDGPVLAAFGRAMAEAVGAAVAIYVIGRLAIRPVFRFVGNTASREMFLALVLLIVLGTALTTEHFGMSMVLGAFLAGLLLAETEYRHEIAVDIEPFKGLLLGLFFVSIGMSIDIAQVAANPLWLVASVAGMYLFKSPIVYVLARLFGEPRPVAAEMGLLLGQSGEFAFIAIGLALTVGLMPNDTAQFMLIVARLTMMSTPPVAQLARKLALALEAREAGSRRRDTDVAIGLNGHVIVVGYGRVGQMLGSVLDALEVPHVGLDNDGALVARFRRAGTGIFYGDASRAELLRKFGADGAAALVVTMDNPHIAEQVVQAARRNWPELPIYARARDGAHAARLIQRGASHVIPEIVEASLQLGEMVLMGIGIPDETARRVIEVRRQSEQLATDQRRPDAGSPGKGGDAGN